MAAFLFDASAIVKRYVEERGTGRVQALADPSAGHEIFLTRVTRVEVTSAVARRGRGGPRSGIDATAILSEFRLHASFQYNIPDVSAEVLAEAERLAEVHRLRGYDAVQLAATLLLHRARSAIGLGVLTFVSADGELNLAAQAEGLVVENPASHP